ncbi:MAG: preprotein translocase subunit SecA [Deltaproteobacteria bacterium]|nr:preprotein translocase subunit SecA [Candidatus Anaeroferrophillus wilburensis]MBN2889663.1 preprotein translocase subunit SecA [Deltaproteobacteria bacterium]
MFGIVKKVFGSKNDRELKQLQPLVREINDLEPEMQQLSDEQLQGKTAFLRQLLAEGQTLDDLLPQAFAVVREASIRTLKMRHFDVQLMGGIVLYQGKIAEMKTGEGKTLVATLPVYLNALSGKGVHVVTVNDYLARRDAEWMGAIYQFLGLTVGVILHGLDDQERQAAYGCDITYGTNNEFGFDYLRDNMKFRLEDYVQRELNYAIVDEVDSILVDEARTPLIISGPTEDRTDKYYLIDKVIPRLNRDTDYEMEEKTKTVVLTEQGVARVEQLLKINNLFEPAQMEVLHHVNQALKAHALFKRDVDYVVKDDQVMIVDEFTGRLMPGRRYSDGLHQALEAKEGVKIESENQTLASVTFQNYFRMYNRLAGMTGTADTEAVEFKQIYNLDVVVMPTNMPMIRIDNPDVIYKTKLEKYKAVVEEIIDCHHRGQPVLVGTISIDDSEKLSRMLVKKGVKHEVLNAKFHEKEAEIVSQAGRLGAVTIATNMAGRGTDIVLGGNAGMQAKKKIKEGMTPEEQEAILRELQHQCEQERQEVLAAGGLHILGTERHESRRIDNQLRGRSGRQGDPGSTRFFLALDDDLMRIFGSERIATVMDKLGIEDGEPIQHAMISKAIENAQRRVEGHNFDIRKQLLEYDDVMNKQRETIYSRRREILGQDDLREVVFDYMDEVAADLLDQLVADKEPPASWDREALAVSFAKTFALSIDFFRDQMMADVVDKGSLLEKIYLRLREFYDQREKELGADTLRQLEKIVLLHTLDTLWKEHLYNIDQLKEGIGLRGYGQKDPLREYQREGFDMFVAMLAKMKEDAVTQLCYVRVTREEEVEALDQQSRKQTEVVLSRGQGVDEAGKRKPVQKTTAKIGRNDPCPCGSGKKYKRCCGQ